MSLRKLVLACAALLAALPGAASAASTTVVRDLQCRYPLIGDQPLAAKITYAVPDTWPAWKPTTEADFRASVQIALPGFAETLGTIDGVASIDGTVELHGDFASPSVKLTPSAIPNASTPLVLTGEAPLTTFRAGSARRVDYVLNELAIQLTLRDATGRSIYVPPVTRDLGDYRVLDRDANPDTFTVLCPNDRKPINVRLGAVDFLDVPEPAPTPTPTPGPPTTTPTPTPTAKPLPPTPLPPALPSPVDNGVGPGAITVRWASNGGSGGLIKHYLVRVGGQRIEIPAGTYEYAISPYDPAKDYDVYIYTVDIAGQISKPLYRPYSPRGTGPTPIPTPTPLPTPTRIPPTPTPLTTPFPGSGTLTATCEIRALGTRPATISSVADPGEWAWAEIGSRIGFGSQFAVPAINELIGGDVASIETMSAYQAFSWLTASGNPWYEWMVDLTATPDPADPSRYTAYGSQEIRFDAVGPVTIDLITFGLNLRALDADGNPVVLLTPEPVPGEGYQYDSDGDPSTFDVGCRANAGQDRTIGSFWAHDPSNPPPTPLASPSPGPVPTGTPTPTLTPTPPVHTPSPSPTPPVTPTPTATPGPAFDYTLRGTTTLNTLTKGSMPLSGAVTTRITPATGAVSGSLQLNDTQGRLTALGFLPVTVSVGFVPSGTTTGTLGNAGLTLLGKVRIKVKSAKAFGAIPLAGGNTCQTKQLTDLTLKSTGPFDPYGEGNALAGTYAISDLNGCGLFNGLISPAVAGGGNSISVTLDRS